MLGRGKAKGRSPAEPRPCQIVYAPLVAAAWPIGAWLSASFASAAAAKVEREFFYLFARLRVKGDLPYRHPAVVTDVGCFVGRWVQGGCARLSRVHSDLQVCVGRVPGCANTCGTISLSTATSSHIMY